MYRLALPLLIALLLAAGCGNDGSSSGPVDPSSTTAPSTTAAPSVDDAAAAAFSVSLDGIEADATVPVAFTCDGDDEEPAVIASSPPDGTVAYALVVEDPDAPTVEPFVHWVVGDIVAADGPLDLSDAVDGVNDFGQLGWGGPCPPVGDPPHEYAVQLYALDAMVGLSEGVMASELRAAIAEQTIGLSQVSVYYGR